MAQSARPTGGVKAPPDNFMKVKLDGKGYTLRPSFLEKCEWFAQANDSKRLTPIPHDPQGYTAVECFFAHETLGRSLPCREPQPLAVLLNGKEWHGVTVEMVATDLVDALITPNEVRQNYPAWVATEIFSQVPKLALKHIGFIPTFLKSA